MTEAAAVRAMITRTVNGRDVSAEVIVTLEANALALETGRGRVTLPFVAIAGAGEEGATLVLYLRRGDAVRVASSPELAVLAAELERRVHALPELTRSLRAMGSRRAAASPDSDRYFAPFITARRAAESGASATSALTAFDAGRLRAALLEQLAAFAAERYPEEPPERRALEAELVDGVEPLLGRLDALQEARESLARSDDAERYVRWSDWTAALQRVFEGADDGWLSMQQVLDPGRRGGGHLSRWRRFLSRTGSRRAR